MVPIGSAARIEQSKSRYVYVLGYFWLSQSEISILTPRVQHDEAATLLTSSFWRALLTVHLVERLLFITRWLPCLTYYVARYALWMDSARKVTLHDNTSILNLNCRVRNSSILTHMPGLSLTCQSTRFYSPVPTIHG